MIAALQSRAVFTDGYSERLPDTREGRERERASTAHRFGSSLTFSIISHPQSPLCSLFHRHISSCNHVSRQRKLRQGQYRSCPARREGSQDCGSGSALLTENHELTCGTPTHLQTERTIQAPQAGQAQIAVKATGLCGSDLHYYIQSVPSPVMLNADGESLI